VYPAAAVKAKTQGAVRVDATIAPGGVVIDAVVVKSIPLLDQAAIDAVRQWVFEPTRQKGPIVMTVTVTFSLK
jgi:periplasmic protein TonB